MDNPELGMLAIKRIEADPETFDMKWWGLQTACGTVACLAGHVLLAAGYTFCVSKFLRPDGTIVADEGGEAAQLLGMSYDEEVLPLNRDDVERKGTLAAIWSEYRSNEEVLALFREMVEKSMDR